MIKELTTKNSVCIFFSLPS